MNKTIDSGVHSALVEFLTVDTDTEYAATLMDEAYHVISMAAATRPDELANDKMEVPELLYNLRRLRNCFCIKKN